MMLTNVNIFRTSLGPKRVYYRLQLAGLSVSSGTRLLSYRHARTESPRSYILLFLSRVEFYV